MSYADRVFVENAKDIIEKGTDTSGQEVRPHWPDGEPAYTIKRFGVCNRYDLRKEFPAITLRKVALKSCMNEILWIYQKKSNNIHDLKPHIWDEWADENGSIGKAYGYQVDQVYKHHKYNPNKDENITDAYPSAEIIIDDKSGVKWVGLDQMDAVLYDLRNAPFGRRIMISLWNIHDLSEMRLQPCCWSIIFNVTDEGKDKLVLNAVLNHRSNDFLTANGWNTCQYALLLMMVAQSVGMEAGELVVMITDEHIYDRHVDIVKELIEREQYPAPIVKLNPNVTNFYDFTTDDLTVENYQAGEQVKNIPVAI